MLKEPEHFSNLHDSCSSTVSPPDSFVPCVLYRLTCGDVEERESQTVTSVTESRSMEGGNGRQEVHGERTTFHCHLSASHSPIARKLMKNSMIICCSAILCFPLSCQAWGDAGWWQSCHRFYHRFCFYWLRI